MTKQTNIFNKLKANLKVLLPVCFALMISVGSASAVSGNEQLTAVLVAVF